MMVDPDRIAALTRALAEACEVVRPDGSIVLDAVARDLLLEVLTTLMTENVRLHEALTVFLPSGGKAN
jgi:hypothetical protein